MTLGHSSLDNVVIKAPTDRRLYRVLNLSNGLTALLIHDPEIFPQPNPDNPSSEKEADGEEDSETDQEEGEEDDEQEEDEEDEEDDDDDDDEEEEEEEEEEELVGSNKTTKNSSSGVFPTKKAAAAMCVGVGSFADPFDAQGLAHFLEHMLFMGSSEFPDENEYDSYLSKHGGSSNAYTQTEYTCYHFEVNRKFFKESLKRFSQFFVSPLVKAEAMEREVLAVDSEFNQVMQNDGCRLQQLQCHTSTPGHAFNRFFWGNKKSLFDAMEKGINLREKILQLYEENYHGGLMKLVLIGGESLDTLEEWVLELFSNVKKGHYVKDTKKNVPIWETGKMYWLEAVKDLHTLSLSWTLPCLDKEYLKKPEDYLAHLIGHEGGGSLHSILKAKGWATSLSVGVGDEGMHRSSIAYIFVLSICLTDSGLDRIHDVVGIVYQFLKLLREASPQEWIFKELQDIGNMEFQYAEEQPQDDYAAELSENLLLYSKEHIIYGDYAFEVWDEKLIEHVLSFFSPDNMRVDVLSKSFNKQSKAVKHEPWFGSQYIEEVIPPSVLEYWRNPPEIDPSLHLPLKNDFIPHDFSIRSANNSKDLDDLDFPKCIVDDPMMMFWHKLDWTFNVPRANTYFLINIKEAYKSVKSCVLTELFLNLLKDELNEILYQAEVAKLETTLSIIADKLELKLYGFSDKLSTLLSKILIVSRSFQPTNDRFKVIKENMERAYRNTNMKPLNHSSYLRLQVLREKFWDVDDKLSCLVNLTLSDLKVFVPELLSQLYIEGLCHGNLSLGEAINISNIFKDIMPVQSLPRESRHQECVLCLPFGASLIRNVSVKNKSEVNSVAEIYFQIEQDTGMEATRSRAIADLFDDIVEEPFFDQLRTKEQLGYTVECGPRMTYRVLGFCFLVQSSKYNPLYLHRRINDFIDRLQEVLDEIDDESFENYRSGLIAKKLEKDPSLIYETNHHWTQIVDKRYLFNMSRLEAEELKNIQKSDVIDWYHTYFKGASPKCRQLAIHVWGCQTDMREERENEENVIEDLVAFKSSAQFYPSLC